MVVPETSPLAANYICTPSGCSEGRVIDDAESNKLATTMFSLPERCRHGLEEVSVVGTGIPHDRVRVRCGSSDSVCLPAEKGKDTCEAAPEAKEDASIGVELPQQCGGFVHEVLLLDARSKQRKVQVKCASREAGIGGM